MESADDTEVMGWFSSARVPVYHVASMARCGETVFLRALDAHPRIRVVHNLERDDTRSQVLLFRMLMNHAGQEIRISHRRLRPFDLRPDQVLVVKQGVWEHRHPFRGLVLVRNPLAIYASLRTYDRREHGDDLVLNWRFNTERMMRWLGDIDPGLREGFEQRTAVDQFCTFYNRRVGALAGLALPVVRYEDFVTDPESELRRAVEALGVAFDPAMLEGHLRYPAGHMGHGTNDLSLAIHPHSMDKYRELLSPEECAEVAERTAAVAARFGYEMGSSGVALNPPRGATAEIRAGSSPA